MRIFEQRVSLQKSFSGILAVIMIANMVLFGLIFHPKQAEAQLAVAVVADAVAIIQWVAQKIWDAAKFAYEKAVDARDALYEYWNQFKSSHGTIAEITSSLFLVMMHQILGKITNDIVAWINGGGKGKIRILQDPGKFLRDAADEAGGVLMGAILNVDPKTLCDASFLKQKLAIAFAGPYAVPTFDEKVACTFSGMADGLRKFKEDFRNGGWRSWIEYTQAPNNQIGQTLIVADEMARIKEQRGAEAVAKLNISKGFLAQEKCTVEKGPASDPGKWVGQDVEKAFNEASGAYFNQQAGISAEEYGNYVVANQGAINNAGSMDLFKNQQEFLGERISKIGNTGFSSVDDFKSWLVSSGGKVSCKTVTPAEQISELTSTALQAPIKKLEDAIQGLYPKTGTGMGQVLRPYVMAIAGAGLNLLLKKEQGLISDLFAAPPPKRNRNQREFPSDAVQKSTMNANSAGQIASSANDFQSFILKSLVDFSIFVSTAAQVMGSAEELGRLPLNRLEYARIFNETTSGNNVKNNFLQSNAKADDENSDKKLIGHLKGWLTNVDCEAAVSNTLSPDITNPFGGAVITPAVPKESNKPFASVTAIASSTVPFNVYMNASSTTNIFPIKVAICNDIDTSPGIQIGPTEKMITTYPSGKIFFEEAQWCGAYSQETPLEITTFEYPVSQAIGPAGPSANLYGYDDDEDKDAVIDRFKRVVSASFTDTFIVTRQDNNHDNKIDTATAAATGLAELSNMRPNFTGAVLDINGQPTGTDIRLAQAAAAGDYTFGGYNQDGFSKDIFQISTGIDVGDLPVPLAGAEAVFYPPNGRIYIFGGRNMSGYSGAVYEFSPGNQSIRTMSARLPQPAYGITGAYYSGLQRIYLFGGKAGETHPATGDSSPSPALITDAYVSNQILEFNQQTDTVIKKQAALPEAVAHASAAIASDAPDTIFIFGGIDQYGQGVGSITAYEPRKPDNGRAINTASRPIQPRGYLAALPVDSRTIRIFGGEDVMGRWDIVQDFDALNGSVVSKTLPSQPLSQMGRSLDAKKLIGGILNWPAGSSGAKIFPQGDIYYIPGDAPAISKSQPVLQKFYSPTHEGASASLINIREYRFYADPTLTVLNRDIMNELHTDGDSVYMPKDGFYPELAEKVQELAEKLRIIKGYHYKTPNQKDYEAGIAQQVGSMPDDDPYDNNPRNPLYPDRPKPGATEATCSTPYLWDQTTSQCVKKGYKGSVSDVTTKYKNLAEIYQVLYSGASDERALEGIDPNMTILSPEETNIKLALIGRRCPALPPSATSTPDIAEGCPSLSGPDGKYNMAKRFMFEGDDTRQNPTGLTTGFATNPFNNKKSSSLAGILNLDEMATQLQAMPPDKNIVKLIRLRQILEQLQVWDKAAPIDPAHPKSTATLRAPGSSATSTPDALTGVDTIQVSLFGFDNIQNWLNATSTANGRPDKNKSIQELIEAYGYTSAKEAYPEISKDLDAALQDAVNQVTDKMREVFVKRMEEAMERARIDAEYRLKRFTEYARDINSTVKLSLDGDSARRLFGLIDPSADQIEDDMFVLRAEAFTSDKNDPHWIDNIINGGTVDNNERSGLIGAAIYKIKALAEFIGMNTESVEFTTMLTQYRQSGGQTPEKIRENINGRLKLSVTDVYLLYRGVSDLTNQNLSPAEKARVTNNCGFDEKSQLAYCDLNAGGVGGRPVRIYKDASMKLKELGDNLELAMEEFSKIKGEFTNIISDGQNQKQGFEDLLSSLNALEASFNAANACVGMSDIKWKPPSYVESLWTSIGGAEFARTAGNTAASHLVGIGVLGLAASGVLLPLIPVIAVVAGIFNYYQKKKAKKKYNKEVKKAVEKCMDGMISYNRQLGQLADNFVCGRTNQIYQEQ